jgi:hypothetical protein
MRPTGLRSFTWKPALPTAWSHAALKSIHAFGEVIDLEVTRGPAGLLLAVKRPKAAALERILQDGDTMDVFLPEDVTHAPVTACFGH